jgi:hypothetical protein
MIKFHRAKAKRAAVPKAAITGYVQKRLEELQVQLPARPMKNGEPLSPRLPGDLTALNDIKLGQLYSEFCTVAQWAKAQLAVLSVEKSIAKYADRLLRSQTHLIKEGTVPDKAAQVESDSEVVKVYIDCLKTEGVEAITAAVLDGYIIGKDACSRELTRRQAVGELNTLQR